MKRSFTFQMRVVPREYPVPECRKMFRDFFDPQEIPSYESKTLREDAHAALRAAEAAARQRRSFRRRNS